MSGAHPSPATGPRPYAHAPASLYVTAAFYDGLMRASADLGAVVVREGPVDAAREREVARLLAVEARLLDQGALTVQAYTQWLSLYTEDCAYWIPGAAPAPDPRQYVTLEFHDRRRLLDRVARLGTGLAYSQLPASRTARQFSGLEVWPSPERPGEWHARCSFTLAEAREGHTRVLAGWNGFVLRETSAGLRIVLKQVNLVDNDRPQGNNSFFL